MHRVLARQLRRVGLILDETPNDLDVWKRFLERVGSYYEEADRGRYLLEQSLRLSSNELIEANNELRNLARKKLAISEARYRDLFQLSRIATWEEDFSEAARELERLRQDGVEDLAAYFAADPGEIQRIVEKVEVLNVNPAVGRLVGSTELDSMIGPVSAEMVTPENTPAWITQLLAIWTGLETVRIDHLVGSRLDGEVFHGVLEWHAPRLGDAFDYSRVVVTIIDITELVEAEQRMQDVLQSKDEFLASISHELRTPLTSVLGFAEVLREMGEEAPDEERNSLLEIIASQAGDLSNIVEDLLVAARAELGQLTVGAVPVDLHAQVAQIIEAGHGFTKNVQVPPRPATPIRAVGDPQRVRQVLRNLVVNAMRYGGNHVHVEIERVGEHVFGRVIDDGGGLDETQAEKVFERYYRTKGDDSLTGSVGIGLTISRDLARMMGGDLFYERSEGLTVFTLRLNAVAVS